MCLLYCKLLCKKASGHTHNSEPLVSNVTALKLTAERKMHVNMIKVALRRRGLQDLAEGQRYVVT